MKMRRSLTLFLSGVFAAGILVFIILILPPVQRWLVLAALETPEMSRAEIGRVRIRPGSTLIENLVFEKRGMKLAFDRALVRGPFWKAAFGGDVRLTEYELDGLLLTVDSYGSGEQRMSDTLVDAAFILAPFAFELALVDLNGVIEFRLGSDRSVSVNLAGQGGDFGVGQTGRLALNGELTGTGLFAEALPIVLGIDLRREEGFRRIESSLEGGLGGDAPIVEFTAEFSYENAVSEADLALVVDLQRIDELLSGADVGRLSSGKGEFTFSWAANSSGESVAEGLMVATDLVSAGMDYRIDEIRAPFRVAVAPGTSLSLRAPVEVRRTDFLSDVLVELTAVVDEPYWRIDGTFSGDRIRMDDLAGLGVFFAGASDPDSQGPAWGGIRGRLGLDFERIEIRSGLAMESVTVELEFADDHTGLRHLDSTMGGGSLTGDATLGFDPGLDEPYDLDGAWKGRGIQLEELGPARADSAVIEGRFDLDLAVHAEALILSMIVDRMSGTARFRGGPGVYRGLATHARSASSVADFFGALFSSESLRAVSELSSELAEIHYDSIEMEATQSPGEGLEVSRLLMQGPEVKLYGQGKVIGSRPAALMVSPMRFDLRRGAKGRLAELLGAVGLVSGARRDWEGYLFLSEPFSVRGTPEDPDVSGLLALLREAAINALR